MEARVATYAPSGSITPSDTAKLTKAADAIYVGTTGDITLLSINNEVQLFKTVPVGIFQVGCLRVNSTGTTAQNLVALNVASTG